MCTVPGMKHEPGQVTSVSRSMKHGVGKHVVDEVRLVEGLGVEGDAHKGATVKHRSRVKKNPNQPNLRQVHLVAAELIDELVAQDFPVGPGVMGENVLTRGIDLCALPYRTRLRLGEHALIEISGLRNPCKQLEAIKKGLMAATLDRDDEGNLVRKLGVMAVILEGGVVRPGDPVEVLLPEPPHVPQEPV